jgi:uncharacterized protein (DUF302 family)
MSYYFSKKLNISYESGRKIIEEKLKKIGFGIVSEIDMHEKFKEKLGVEFRRYKIIGACNPKYAYQAVSSEDKIGLMLPCNIVIQEREENSIEISAIDPVASMQAVNNPELFPLAEEIKSQLKSFIESF